MNPHSPSEASLTGLRETAHSIVDHQNGGMVVSTFSHPSHWQAQSQVIWNMQHTSLPALIHAAAFNPNGAECFEFIPTQAFFWLENDFGAVPIGQNSHGLVRMPPRPAPDALANLVIPALRRDRQNLRVTAVQHVQNLIRLFDDPPPQHGEEVMARVEYEMHGRAIEEEFYGVYDWNQGMQFNWGFGRLICFRAERGRLDAMRPTFWRIPLSLRNNPQWRQRYEQVVQQLQAGFEVRISETYARFRREAEIGRANIIHNEQLRHQRDAQVQASIEQTHRQIHERSQSHFDRQEIVGDILLNRTPYHDPNSSAGNHHYVQGDPKYVWTDGQGNFHTTDDPFDNPNHHMNGNWTQAQRVERGR